MRASKTYESGCCICGLARNYVIRLSDINNHEVYTFIRKTWCKFLVFKFRPDEIEAIKFPGNSIGTARYSFSVSSSPPIIIQNSQSEEVLRIGGPLECSLCFCGCAKETKFNILSADRKNVKGTLNRQWNPNLKSHTINIFFDHFDIDIDKKILIIGSAFMLDTKYFRGMGCF